MPESATRPRYLEGYPRLDMLRVKAAADDRGKICWFVDQRGLTHGLARLKDITDRHMTIETRSRCRTCLPGTALSGLIEFTPPAGAMHRLMTNCPRCAKPKILLVYAATWACSHCHRLPYRSQTMDYHTRSFERREKLRLIVKLRQAEGDAQQDLPESTRRTERNISAFEKHLGANKQPGARYRHQSKME